MIEPSLQLNFAKTRQLDRRITFARADTADNQASYYDQNGILKFARKGEPRFTHDPATGSSLGLLVEEARTNLLTYSEQFDNAAWTKTGLLAFGSSSVANAITAPDGTTTADKIVEDTANSEHYADSISTSCAAGTYVASIFWHTSSTRSLYLRVVHGGEANPTSAVMFYKSTLTLGTPNGNAVGAFAQNVGNGWWRVALAFTLTATRDVKARVQLREDVSVYTGDGTSGIYIWGAQLEEGAFPTSYIPTVASTVTRVADSAVMTGANFSSWYRQDEGTFVADAAPATTSGIVVGVDDGTVNNRITLYLVTGTGLSALYSAVGGAAQGTFSSTAWTSAGGKFALGYKLNDFAGSFSGGSVVTDTSGTVPTVNTLRLVTRSDGGGKYSGTIARITYWPVRISNAELQALSKL